MKAKETKPKASQNLCERCGKEKTKYSKHTHRGSFYGWECEPCKWNIKFYGEFPYTK